MLSLRRSEKGKYAHFTSAVLTSNQMYLLASGWHFGSTRLPTPTLLQSDGMNSRAVLYCLLAYRLSTWIAYESIHLKLSFQITAQFSSIIFLKKSLACVSPFLLAHGWCCPPRNFLVCSSYPKEQHWYLKMNGHIAIWRKRHALLVWVLSDTSYGGVCIVGML